VPLREVPAYLRRSQAEILRWLSSVLAVIFTVVSRSYELPFILVDLRNPDLSSCGIPSLHQGRRGAYGQGLDRAGVGGRPGSQYRPSSTSFRRDDRRQTSRADGRSSLAGVQSDSRLPNVQEFSGFAPVMALMEVREPAVDFYRMSAEPQDWRFPSDAWPWLIRGRANLGPFLDRTRFLPGRPVPLGAHGSTRSGSVRRIRRT
jgi:hypothetical protein